MRRCRCMAITSALWLVTIQHILEHRRRHKIQRCLELGHVQVLATSGAPAIIEGRDDGGKRKARHHEVRIGPIRIRRGAIWPARQPGHATQGRQHRSKARLPRIGPPPPQHRRAEENDIRLQLAQLIVAQPPFLHGTRGKILRHQVSPAHKAFHNIDGFRMGHVEAKSVFAGVIVGIIATTIWSTPLAAKGRGIVQRVRVRMRLDTHHRSAIFHQVTGGHGSRSNPAKIQNFQSFQRPHALSLSAAYGYHPAPPICSPSHRARALCRALVCSELLSWRISTPPRPRVIGRDHQAAGPAPGCRLRHCARRAWAGDDAGVVAWRWPVRTVPT